jgi:hypothetical protein
MSSSCDISPLQGTDSSALLVSSLARSKQGQQGYSNVEHATVSKALITAVERMTFTRSKEDTTKNEEFSVIESTSGDAENISALIGMLKTKKRRALESLVALP